MRFKLLIVMSALVAALLLLPHLVEGNTPVSELNKTVQADKDYCRNFSDWGVVFAEHRDKETPFINVVNQLMGFNDDESVLSNDNAILLIRVAVAVYTSEMPQAEVAKEFYASCMRAAGYGEV